MQALSTQSRWKPWLSIVWFVICLLILIFPGAYVQSNFGMTGLLLSELFFLAAAIIYTLIMKTPLKEVFPIKKISILELVGVGIFAIAAILSNFICVGIGMILFPSGLEDVNSITEFMLQDQLGFIPLVLILAVSPAICEEAIMRGVLLSHFRGLKKEWLGIFFVGLAFGILHLSPVKFLSTGFLGACLAYLVVKKNNILLPMIVHFLNNLLSAISLYLVQGSASEISETSLNASNSLQMFGTYLFLGCAAPILFVVAANLMKTQPIKGKAWAIGGILSGVLLVVGFGIMIGDALTKPVVLQSTVGYNVVEDVPERTLDFVVEEEGTYVVAVTGKIDEGSVAFAIKDKETETLQTGCTEDGTFIISQSVILEEGEYFVEFDGLEGSDGAHIEYTIQIQYAG